LKYVPTGYFLLPLAKVLPLTYGPRKDEGWKDEGYYAVSSYFLLPLRLTDWGAQFINGNSEAYTNVDIVACEENHIYVTVYNVQYLELGPTMYCIFGIIIL
jgi:hypothetical protein